MKAMASDLDGTLVFNREIKKEDLEQIKVFREHGNLFGVCSGRTLKGILKSTEGTIDCDFYIASSGSIIADCNLNIIYKDLIDHQTTKELTLKYQDQYCVLVCNNDGYHVFRHYQEDYGATFHTSIDDIDQFEVTGISIVYQSVEEATDANIELKQSFPDLTGHQNADSIDITTKACSKGTAVKKIKEILDIDLIGAIGDNYNDLPMLKDADHGFTFPYAPQEVQDTASHIVDHVYNALIQLEDLK